MNIFVLTGAGCSAESGMGTFRDRNALWTRFDPMKLATPEAFARQPDDVHAFYNMRRRLLLEAEPNAAHRALAELEAGLSRKGGRLFLCTQNVDDLHERAGSRTVLHMHGELFKVRCVRCDAVTAWSHDLGRQDRCPACGVVGGLRPNVVWFGEIPQHLDEIYAALRDADRFVAIGTSGAVYPAAGFVMTAQQAGIPTCEINLKPSDNTHLFDDVYSGPASETVPVWVRGILSSG